MKVPHLKFEKEIWTEGGLVCGVDEVGCGCLAGPVVAAAVVLPENHRKIKGVRDCKLLNEKQRKEICEKILDQLLDFGIGLVTAVEIDKINIRNASKKAMKLSFDGLSTRPDLVLVDAYNIDGIEVSQKAILKGDEICYSIACASIIAKVYRDSIVSGLDKIHPEYGFSKHKGYGTKLHRDAIKKHGLTREHRKSFLRKFEL